MMTSVDVMTELKKSVLGKSTTSETERYTKAKGSKKGEFLFCNTLTITDIWCNLSGGIFIF